MQALLPLSRRKTGNRQLKAFTSPKIAQLRAQGNFLNAPRKPSLDDDDEGGRDVVWDAVCSGIRNSYKPPPVTPA